MNPKSSFIAYIVLIASLVSLSECDSRITGFTTHLIHRDSPQSPSYDPSLSPYHRLVNALKRSFARAKHFDQRVQQNGTLQSDVSSSGGEYLMQYSLGTPLVPSLGILDTGSDLTWTQCQPCILCFKQSLPIFQPKSSQTYSAIPCNSPKCHTRKHASKCRTNDKNCVYNVLYGDGSFTQGELATETFALSSTSEDTRKVSVPNIKFGCGFANQGKFSGVESGIVGLGGGQVSLVRQLGPSAQGKFSYCLIPSSDLSHSSKLHFGANAEVSGKQAVSTPLINKAPETFYYLTLQGISVGNQRLEFYNQSLANDSELDYPEGNIIIDSGTTLTLLPPDFYAKLEAAIKGSIELKQIDDPAGLLSLCYFTRNDIVQIPEITVHFKGADVKLSHDNVFLRTSETSLCLAAGAAYGYTYIYGNIAQANFLVGYDLVKRTVSFKPTNCAQK